MHGKKLGDKEVAYKAFLKNLTESHYYGYMNLPENGENIEYDHHHRMEVRTLFLSILQ